MAKYFLKNWGDVQHTPKPSPVKKKYQPNKQDLDMVRETAERMRQDVEQQLRKEDKSFNNIANVPTSELERKIKQLQILLADEH